MNADDLLVYAYNLQERIGALELALEEQGWQRLAQGADQEFSRDGLRFMIELARIVAIKNPLVKRALAVKTHYVWAQGVSVRHADEGVNDVIQRFLDDEGNRAEMFGHQARAYKEKELATTGNLFLVFFTDSRTGRVRVRSIPVEEIEEIYTNPDDRRETRYYKRVWEQERLGENGSVETEQRTAYYPDWRYQPTNRWTAIGGHEINWDQPVSHVRVGGFQDMRFGLSEIYAAIDWGAAYKSYLEDWATFARALARYAHKLSLQNANNQQVSAAARAMSTTLSSSSNETNPPPLTGSAFVSGPGAALEPMRIGGANASAEDSRRLLLMVAAATDLPETFFGDANVGNHATAKTLDRPTELAMLDRQALWADVYRDIISYVLWKSAVAPQGALRGVITVEDEGDGTPRLLLDEKLVNAEVVFPPILEHDPLAAVQAITAAAERLPDEKLIARLLLTALGVDDLDDAMNSMFPDGEAPADAEPAPAVAEALQMIAELMSASELRE